jgi:hypothetical protein
MAALPALYDYLANEIGQLSHDKGNAEDQQIYHRGDLQIKRARARACAPAPISFRRRFLAY